MTAVYIHIPFCKRRCNYCDFITYANIEAMLPDYLSALQMEILNSKWECDQAETVYIGGGTPSLISPKQIAGLLDAVRQRYGIAKDAEITVEANPGTVNTSYYAQIRALGVNRLSFGVQSFSDAELQLLGRIHSADEAIEQYFQAREAGFDNISLDLIYGLPEQTLSDWRKNLDVLKGLLPEHLSIYSLILEPGTLMTQWVEKGLVALPDDDLVADMFEVTLRTLAALGYEYYEISSWALKKRVRAGTIKSTGGVRTILALALGRLARWGRCAGETPNLLAGISRKRALMRVANIMVVKARKK